LKRNKFPPQTYQSSPLGKRKRGPESKLLPGQLDYLAEKEGQNIEFVVENRAGSKVGHVDAMSRHVVAILQEGILDMKNILQKQAKDAFYAKHNPGTYKSKQEFFWAMMEFSTSAALTVTTS
jgi:hypothetical protein